MHNTLHPAAKTLPGATEGRFRLRLPRIAWLPLPLFSIAVIGLWLSDIKAPLEYPALFIALNLLFATLPALGIAFLFLRNFLLTGAWGVALFGSGAVLWSVSGLSSLVPVVTEHVGPSVNVIGANHNLTVWAASVCTLAGAALLQRGWSPARRRQAVAAAAYGLALGAAACIVFMVLQDLTPVFFVQGKGASLQREIVLASTIFAIILTLLLLRKGVSLRSPFLDWFALALILFAVGNAGLMLQSTPGGVLGWVSHAAQFLGGGYMLVAAYAAFRDTKPAFFVLAQPQDDNAPYRYSVAVAVVLIAAVLRLVFLQALGTSFAFLTFYPAVMLAALYGGGRAGALATFAGILFADYFWIEPVGSLHKSPIDWLASAIFMVNCLMVSWIVDLLQKAQAQLRSAEADRRAKLERAVADRTAELGLARNEAELANEASTRHLAAATATEAELQAVLDVVPAGIWIARDPSYRMVQANRLATEWMRIPEGANSSKSAPSLLRFDIFDEDGRPVSNEQLPIRRAAGGEVVNGYEFEWRFPNGESRFLYGNATPLHDADGNIAGAVAAFIDITERKRAEAALRESEARLQAVLDRSPDPIFVKDREGRQVRFPPK